MRLVCEADGLRVWSAPCTRRVLLQEELSAERTVPAVVLSAARGEWVSVQLILRAETDLAQVAVRAEGLPAPLVRWARFVQVHRRSSPQAVAANAVIADPLMPADECDLRAGHNQPVWVTWRVPENAAAGEQQAALRLSVAGRQIARIPLRLRVWGFTLPAQTRPVILGNLWMRDDWLARYTDAAPWPIWQEYLRNLRAHGINAIASPADLVGIWTEDAEPQGLEEYAERLRYALDELGFVRFRFPGAGGLSGGRWNGIEVFERLQPQKAFWIAGDRCVAQQAAPEAQIRWERRGGVLGIQPLSPATEASGSWVEYQVQATEAQAGSYELLLQVEAVQAEEEREIWWDGQSVARVNQAAALNSPRGFLPTGVVLTVTPGTHRVRLVFARVIGQGDKVAAIILRRPDAAPLEQLELQTLRLTEEFRAAYATHLRRGMQFLRGHGWETKAQLKLWDEPTMAEHVRVRAVYQFARSVLPEARLELSEEPSELLLGAVNVWTPYMNAFDPIAAAQRQQQGEEVWLYANALHGVDCPGAPLRLIGWLLWRYRLDGYLLWSVNYADHDPWSTPSSASTDWFKRGTFIYPHPADGSPVDSVRWEVLRDGLEDYACLELLDALAQRAPDPAAIRARAQAEVMALAASLQELSRDDEALEGARARLCELIEELAQRGG